MRVLAGQNDIESRHLVFTALRTAATAGFLVFLYFEVPIDFRQGASVVGRLVAGFSLFTVALVYEVRAITRAKRPILRAAVAMALIIPLFVIMWAWTYLTMSRSAPAAFGQRFSRITALYFAVTVFGTVGFGDIVPKTDIARLVVTLQILSDLIVVAVVVRLLIGAARGALNQRAPAAEAVNQP
jgi:voltage-gated potassium channel